ncbi:2OG-Fe(II) oxygenase [Arsukibacterium perlucidum]|uniref:2OG-Fe(II) oxygenase n=1 Tax=Arsukibacterium perlucidum TaxID=368811 RepID=UPI00036A8E48|nr:2OG-Fe(II) oxygenase [Arsukibacterium perlucidum]
MWLNKQQVTTSALNAYRKSMLQASPRHIVIDNLFDNAKLDAVINVLQQDNNWQTQQHSYSKLYVDNAKWQKTPTKQRFVQRDVWQRPAATADVAECAESAGYNIALQFLLFLRSNEFMSLLSQIFRVPLTDLNVAKPAINTNYFRLSASDFVNQHADDSPGREVCMLLYLNKDWQSNNGGELVFMGNNKQQIKIEPLYNRCVLFDPSSVGSEHWVNPLKTADSQQYRYNVTSWYWTE